MSQIVDGIYRVDLDDEDGEDDEIPPARPRGRRGPPPGYHARKTMLDLWPEVTNLAFADLRARRPHGRNRTCYFTSALLFFLGTREESNLEAIFGPQEINRMREVVRRILKNLQESEGELLALYREKRSCRCPIRPTKYAGGPRRVDPLVDLCAPPTS